DWGGSSGAALDCAAHVGGAPGGAGGGGGGGGGAGAGAVGEIVASLRHAGEHVQARGGGRQQHHVARLGGAGRGGTGLPHRGGRVGLPDHRHRQARRGGGEGLGDGRAVEAEDHGRAHPVRVIGDEPGDVGALELAAGDPH